MPNIDFQVLAGVLINTHRLVPVVFVAPVRTRVGFESWIVGFGV